MNDSEYARLHTEQRVGQSEKAATWNDPWRRSGIRTLWGERDGWIAPAKTMAAATPDCRLITVPGIGHSMNLDSPALYPGYFGAWFGGLSGSEVAI